LVSEITQDFRRLRRSLHHEEVAVRLTPLDIQNHRFSKRLRGIDAAEVEAFLRLIAEDYEDMIRQNEALREKAHRLEARVAELSENEIMLQNTLVTAQHLSDDLKKTAVRESESLLSEAEVKAEKILAASHRRAAKLAQDIREMKLLRGRLGAAIRSAIETHLSLLEALSQEEPEGALGEDKVAYLTPSPRAAESSEA
jgi:cell division initiation protein